MKQLRESTYAIALAWSLAMLSFAPHQLSAAVTNIVDIAALAACKDGTTNGWTVCGIDSYADGKTNVRLSEQNDYLVSPAFDDNISQILISVKSSSSAGRRLSFFPLPTTAETSPVSCDYSPTRDTYRNQTFSFTNCTAFNSFKICFDDPKNGQTGWGFCVLTVITDDLPRFASPERISVSDIRATSAKVSWEPNPLVSSNIVTLAKITDTPESHSTITNYDFELCINHGTGDTQDRATELSELYPDFSGEKIYYPAESQGLLRISTGSANGRLTHGGFENYDGMAVAITAKRYTGDQNCHEISAYWIDDAMKTNTIGTISIGDEFTTQIIPLSETPGNVAINIGNLDGTRSDRRFVIDSLKFLANYIPATVTTNIVANEVTEDAHMTFAGLKKKSRYLASVTAVDSNGKCAKPSPAVEFGTAECDTGTLFYLR